MKETVNLKLKKPEYGDDADIEVINENMDTIDEHVTENADGLVAIDADLVAHKADYASDSKTLDLTPQLQNGWVQLGANYPGLILVKSKNGYSIIGNIRNGVTAAGTVIATIPADILNEWKGKKSYNFIPVVKYGNSSEVKFLILVGDELKIHTEWEWTSGTWVINGVYY